MLKVVGFILILIMLSSCSYMASMGRYYSAKKRDIKRDAKTLCLVSEECTTLSGEWVSPTSSKYLVLFQKDDGIIVASSMLKRAHKGMYDYVFSIDLPKGKYDYTVLDIDRETERILQASRVKKLTITQSDIVNRGEHLIKVKRLEDQGIRERDTPLIREVMKLDLESIIQKQNIFNPKIHYSLDNPIFSKRVINEGMFDIMKFVQKSHFIYAFDTEDKSKIPVLFVHGTGGSPRDFRYFIDNLDREKFRAYGLYYPSGDSLDFYSKIFAEIFLSQRWIDDQPFIVVAHSNGGLLVRNALNSVDNRSSKTHLFISISTGFGGIHAAAGSQKAPYRLPLWIDIEPKSTFITHLFDTPLNTFEYHLLFSYKNSSSLLGKMGSEQSDGSVALSSQLRMEAQDEATTIRGFNESHTSVLKSKAVKHYIDQVMDEFYNRVKGDHSALK